MVISYSVCHCIFHPSLIFEGKVICFHSNHLKGLHPNGRLQALPTNIRVVWKRMEGTNTLAYYHTATITIVKCFIELALGVDVISFSLCHPVWLGHSWKNKLVSFPRNIFSLAGHFWALLLRHSPALP